MGVPTVGVQTAVCGRGPVSVGVYVLCGRQVDCCLWAWFGLCERGPVSVGVDVLCGGRADSWSRRDWQPPIAGDSCGY